MTTSDSERYYLKCTVLRKHVRLGKQALQNGLGPNKEG